MILAPLIGWTVLRVVRRLPSTVRARQIAKTAEDILDLSEEVDPERDHIRGPQDALVTFVEYGDFECPYCGQAEGVIRELLADFGDELRYVWRHLPLNDVHTSAQIAAEASEAAAAQGRFWEMHDVLLSHQGELRPEDLVAYAKQLGLDAERMADELRRRVHAPRVSEDVASADESGVSGTPTFFVNGRRHYGAYDVDHARRRRTGRAQPGVAHGQSVDSRKRRYPTGGTHGIHRAGAAAGRDRGVEAAEPPRADQAAGAGLGAERLRDARPSSTCCTSSS